MKEIIILGTGCAGCKALFATVEKVVRENHIDAQVSKQEDIMEIMRYNVLTLPAMVIDGQVAATGRLSETEVKKLLTIFYRVCPNPYMLAFCLRRRQFAKERTSTNNRLGYRTCTNRDSLFLRQAALRYLPRH